MCVFHIQSCMCICTYAVHTLTRRKNNSRGASARLGVCAEDTTELSYSAFATFKLSRVCWDFLN